MPAIVGAIKILSVGPSSVVHIGDCLQISPQSSSKTFAGAGSFNTGDFLRTNNALSATNTLDNDIADSTPTTVSKVGGI